MLGAVVAAGILVAAAVTFGGDDEPDPAAQQISITVPTNPGPPGERGGPVVRRTAPPTSTPTPSPTPTLSPTQPPAQESPTAPPEIAAPAPQPRPSDTPAPPAPAVPTAPAPLAFTEFTENRGANLVGVEVVMSATLSMTGEAGSTASVTYGWRDVGPVTFDDRGRATVEIDRSTLLLIPGNARIRAEYTDGTESEPIEMRRDDIGG